jgi:hypothetical protein
MNTVATVSESFSVREIIKLILPKEHGSWSLALEPLALGLLAAPSLAGGPLAIAAIAGFFLRRPLKILLREENCGRWFQRYWQASLLRGLIRITKAAKVRQKFAVPSHLEFFRRLLRPWPGGMSPNRWPSPQ